MPSNSDLQNSKTVVDWIYKIFPSKFVILISQDNIIDIGSYPLGAKSGQLVHIGSMQKSSAIFSSSLLAQPIDVTGLEQRAALSALIPPRLGTCLER